MQKVKIKSIKKLEENLDRYDLTINATQNFFANDILIHNTSFRYAHALDVMPPEGLKQKLVNAVFKLNFRLGTSLVNRWTKKEWKHLNGSRNVIIEKRKDPEKGFYGSEEFRFKATEGIMLHKGEIIFGELVGWTHAGAPIMQPQDTTCLKNKKIQKQYGDKMIYKYGCPEGICDLYVYRIAVANEDGYLVDLSWPLMVKRCKELGLKTVPLLSTKIYDGNLENLTKELDMLVNGESGSDALPDIIDPSHIREGVVIRVESEQGITWMKHKSWCFGILENYIKEDSDYVDTEESS